MRRAQFKEQRRGLIAVNRYLCHATTARRCGALSTETVAHKVLRPLIAVRSAAGVTPHVGVCAQALRVSRPVARRAMLWTLFVVLLVLWFVGVVSSYTLGGFIHLLLVSALIAVVLQLVQGRRVV